MTSDAASRHKNLAAAFGSVARKITNWEAPTPVAEWTAADIVGHLTSWLPPLLRDATGIKLADTSHLTDPSERWKAHSAAVQQVLDESDVASRSVDDPRFAGFTVATFVDRLYNTDVFMHTWDLARAAGAVPPMDPDFARGVLQGLQAMDPSILRSGGQYGPAIPTDSTNPIEQLMAFVGREPRWTPSAGSGAML